MTVIVEDGTLVTGANSYISEAGLTAYCAARGITLTGNTEELLIQAMDYIESLPFSGIKWTFTQVLQWPRANVLIDGWYQNVSPLPIQLLNGLCETAIAIDQGNGPLIDVPVAVKTEKVGDIEVEYFPGTSPLARNRKINAAIYKLLTSGGTGAVIVKKA